MSVKTKDELLDEAYKLLKSPHLTYDIDFAPSYELMMERLRDWLASYERLESP